ncbi:hypothetical protein IX51_05995 [uncultured archaeon]|nr:hypothetical protein IX51_05995 [uncultured archaeon]
MFPAGYTTLGGGANVGTSAGTLNAHHESHFDNGSYSDPDSGITGDVKAGQNGIAINGGLKVNSGNTILNGGNGITQYRNIGSSGWGMAQVVAQTSGSGSVSATFQIINYSAPTGLYLVMFQGKVDTTWGVIVTTSSDVSGGSYSIDNFSGSGSGTRH